MRFSYFVLILAAFLMLAGSNLHAFAQSNNTCYSYCAGWRLYWQYDPIWKYIEEECSMGGKDTAIAVVKFAKAAATQGLYIDPIIQAFYCSEMIKQGIVPILNSCRSSCNADIWNYAPDLVVTNRFGNRNVGGLYYDEDHGKLNVEIYNNGYGYADESTVKIYTAHTDSRDCNATNWQLLTTFKSEGLAPAYARRNDLQIPTVMSKDITWTPVKDECNKVKIIVDADNEVPELGEDDGIDFDNEYILEVNDLPTLPYYDIKDVEYPLVGSKLDEVRLGFTIHNTGEMDGNPKITVTRCHDDEVLAQETKSIRGGYEQTESFVLSDLFTKSGCSDYVCLEMSAEDQWGRSYAQTYFPVYSGSISGEVLDIEGEPVTDATVYLNTGESTQTDEDGMYYFKGIQETGTYTVSAMSPTHTDNGETTVEIKMTTDPAYCEGNLTIRDADILLMDQPASFEIICPVDNFEYRMASDAFDYRGTGNSPRETLQLAPGEYTVMISKPGYTTTFAEVELTAGMPKSLRCNLSTMDIYTNDSGIDFGKQMNDLWELDLADLYNPYYAEISKDGSTVFLVVSNPRQANTAKVLVYGNDGNKISEIPIPSDKGQLNAVVKSSYDGSYVLIGNAFLYRKDGTLVSRDPNENSGVDQWAYLSPEGSYICDYAGLRANDFTEISYRLMSGIQSDQQQRCPGTGTSEYNMVFGMDDSMYGGCMGYHEDGICRYELTGGSENVSEGEWRYVVSIDATADGSGVLASMSENLSFFRNGDKVWGKYIDTHSSGSQLRRISISPGGNYAVALAPRGFDAQAYIFDAQGRDLLNISDQDSWKYSRFFDVEATGTGIYYVSYDGKFHFGVFGQEGTAQKEDLGELVEQQTGGETQEKQMGIIESVLKALGDFVDAVVTFFTNLFFGGG